MSSTSGGQAGTGGPAGAVPGFELSLPGGGVFRVVPPEVGVPVIRLWLEHEWPMSVREGLELRDRLGWQSSPTDEMMFTTGHDLGGKDAYFIDLKGQVNSFHMGLASRIPKASAPPEAAVLVRQAYDQYIEVLTGFYGTGTTKHFQGRNGPQESTTWTLPSGASLTVGILGRIIDVTVNSPAANRAAETERRYLAEEAEFPTEPPPRPRTNR
ncbi:DUF6301 family protein [Actinomyces glycerinitolerans]|uniref:Uncharacterized protein n=1 Tax=Actinomyces glycerinitolerans TaxID=1892869 RepID=A0A1M4RXH5_9ACTO|nr:DUF6301 family protein [Actinomyces glycerinitolerans]SHE24629.1 Hypothetical protein ACGLYG10_0836 [Actinomyces glycerinitolerans]